MLCLFDGSRWLKVVAGFLMNLWISVLLSANVDSNPWLLVEICAYGHYKEDIINTLTVLMKPVTDVVNSSMPSDESQNIFPAVLVKQPCSLASASLYHFRIECVSRNQEDRVLE